MFGPTWFCMCLGEYSGMRLLPFVIISFSTDNKKNITNLLSLKGSLSWFWWSEVYIWWEPSCWLSLEVMYDVTWQETGLLKSCRKHNILHHKARIIESSWKPGCNKHSVKGDSSCLCALELRRHSSPAFQLEHQIIMSLGPDFQTEATWFPLPFSGLCIQARTNSLLALQINKYIISNILASLFRWASSF